MQPSHDESIKLSPLQIPAKGAWKSEPSGWSILWISRGRAVVRDELRVQVTKSGHVAIVPQGVKASLEPDGAPLSGHELWFHAERLPCVVSSATRVFFESVTHNRLGVILLPKGNALTPLLRGLTERPVPHHHSKRANGEKKAQPLSCPCTFILQVGSVFEELKTSIGQMGAATGEAGRKVMAVLLRLTETELQELNVGELARRCGFSRRHLARLVKDQCGSSLATLVAQTRLDKAADLLRDPERKVMNVAMDCGFKHLGAFSAKFRARFGMTPSDWRKNGDGPR